MPISSRFIVRAVMTALLLLIYGLWLARPIGLTTADLGRHLKNGEMFFKERVIPETNLYSYTYPDYPFFNHHWGSGAVFYAIERLSGFAGLSVLFIAISLFTFFIFFKIAARGSFAFAAALALVILPLLAARTEIRPELFSYFLSAIFFWILLDWQKKGSASRLIYCLPLLILLWVNLHIYFIIGIGLIGAFWGEDILLFFIKRRDSLVRAGYLARIKRLGGVFIVSTIATLANPAGLTGALAPAKIFNNYGYRLFENQSVPFLEAIVKYPPILYFKIAFIVLVASWITVLAQLIRKRVSFSPALLALSVFFSAAAWLAVRNFTLFAYFALAISALNIGMLAAKKRENSVPASWILTAFIALVAFLWQSSHLYQNISRGRGLGRSPGTERAASFFLQENIQGPIFNNYDIGGYLIYYLYPAQRVFVDNRPEAYPTSFFQETYIPMQENEERWKEASGKYGFNAIFFYRNDLTPWAQTFLARRAADPAWAPVFVDGEVIIFLKRNGPNQPIIAKYELPKSMFSVTKAQ